MNSQTQPRRSDFAIGQVRRGPSGKVYAVARIYPKVIWLRELKSAYRIGVNRIAVERWEVVDA